MSWKTDRYRQAAVAYFVYGVLYLFGALYLVETGASIRGAESDSLWWFVIGAVMMVALPALVWMRFKWVTRILALLVVVRIAGLVRIIYGDAGETVPLPWGGEMPRVYGAAVFLTVAAAVCALLVRAGWGPGTPAPARSGAESATGG